MMKGKTCEMVTAVFRNKLDADRAYNALIQRGYTDGEINVLMSDQTRASFYGGPAGAAACCGGATATHHAHDDRREERHEAGTLAVEGMGVGGAIAAALAGGGAGAATGGIIGALTGLGFTEDNANAYHAALRDGGVVMGVTPHGGKDAAEIEEDFERFNGENVCRC